MRLHLGWRRSRYDAACDLISSGLFGWIRGIWYKFVKKSRRIGCVFPHCKWQYGIKQPILRLCWQICIWPMGRITSCSWAALHRGIGYDIEVKCTNHLWNICQATWSAKMTKTVCKRLHDPFEFTQPWSSLLQRLCIMRNIHKRNPPPLTSLLHKRVEC